MENEQNDDIITSENNDEQVEETVEEETEETTEEVEEKPKETPEAKVSRLKRQLKKAEKDAGVEEEPTVKPTVKPKETPKVETDTSGYTLLDIRALNNVPDEDIERVDKFAKSEGISIPEALKHDDLQAILSNRAEKRKTANATNTGKGGRGSSGSSAEKILSDAQKGKYPEDDEGIKKLVAAEHNEKKRKIKKRD